MNKTFKTGIDNGDLKKPTEVLSFFDLASNLLSDLPERSQEIVKKRYGLIQSAPQTLDGIGKDHKITRERVRQIISDSVKKIIRKKNEAGFKKAENKILFTIENNNGIIEEGKLIEKLSGNDYREAKAVAFFGALSEKITITGGKDKIKKSWLVSKDTLNKVLEIGAVAEKILKSGNKLLTDAEIVEKIKSQLGEKNNLTTEKILGYLEILTEIKKNKFGKWGIANWKEVSPKGTRERIYLVFKEKNTPLHFAEIASLIDQYGLSKRKAHPQTVHNELIKDARFILVGRGIYALKEWGYEKGTIQEVLEDILDKSEKPLTKEEVLNKVMKLRKVKRATVMINLNNTKFFQKVNNAYTIKR